MNPAELAEEIKFRLKAPIVVMERVAEGRTVPKAFGEAALSELERIQELAEKLGRKKE